MSWSLVEYGQSTDKNTDKLWTPMDYQDFAQEHVAQNNRDGKGPTDGKSHLITTESKIWCSS